MIADEWMTLDGVVQAPSYPGEDTSGTFRHGGWHARYLDELSMSWVVDNVRGAGGFVLGRGTYEIFASHWPTAPQEQSALAEPLNNLPKYVASTTLHEPLGWSNSVLLPGDLGPAVRTLKAQAGADLHVIGSPGLVRSLLSLDLLDELRIMLDPLVLGGGKRLFPHDAAHRALQLLHSDVTSTGAIILTYAVGKPVTDAG
ncbi:dihydrofolate reductase [Actinoplanes ianthinogenes]|uniref:Dihydrofolate reductase n=1 Tax=Actinoplanes ianthinogenes TaxID=122358 RepID=A0ABM7LNP9_9ACTN|nr:dihydrofolate reductase family protein [Actinoplanes ianthinogenes]BCJ40889.1 dihydrofolate reductase [Actinoplanes ianthinogenes]GGR24456.1 dihydrofolate reductase [Actinoplanes ianthinogenes]